MTSPVEIGNNGYPQYTNLYAACNNNAHGQPGSPSMIDIYRKVVASKAASLPTTANLRRIIVSSGDIDPVVSLHGTEQAVRLIGFPTAGGGERRPWFYNSTATDAALLLVRV